MLRRNSKFFHNVIPMNVFLNSKRQKTTLYDVLNLKKECSSKEIKDSFIKLSKLYHPDKTKNSKSGHQNFLKINEAYSILSRPDSRRNYDLKLENPEPIERKNHYQTYDTSMYENPIFHRYKSKHGASEEKEYYGVKGIKKQPHYVIVLICIGIALIGFTVEMVLVRTSFIFRRDKMKRDSEANELLLEKIRSTSELNGRKYS